MKLIVFDVGNGACSITASPNGYSQMVDCGSCSEKQCPVDQILANKEWLGLKDFNGYTLTQLLVTHPDDDHVRNTKKVMESLPPAILSRRFCELFPQTENIHEDYKNMLDGRYRTPITNNPIWGWDVSKDFEIPMDTILSDLELSKKIKNNSSIVRYISYAGVRVLYSGDMEKCGREWLLDNDKYFSDTIAQGIDIFLAPHHGHNSGFSTRLFEVMGNVAIPILSKGSEANIEGTDVSSEYSKRSYPINYKNLNDEKIYIAPGVLTTRSNGNIYISIEPNGITNIRTQKASSNHLLAS